MTTTAYFIINERIFNDLLFTAWPRMIDNAEVAMNFDRFLEAYIAACDEDGAERPVDDSSAWEDVSSNIRERLQNMIEEGGGFAQDAPRHR